jgi:AcrR family transcriptional regulator
MTGPSASPSSARNRKTRAATPKNDALVASKLRRRDQLTVAALRLFSERAYDEVSIDDIANEAGVAHGLLSYYFGGKRGVYVAALQMVHADLKALTRPLRSDGAVAAQMKGMARRHFEYFRAHPQVMLGLLVSAPRDRETRAIAESAQVTGARELLALLGLPGDPAPMLAVALRGCMGLMHDVTVEWLSHGQNLEIEPLVDLCFDATVAAVEAAVGRPISDETEQVAG